MVISIVASGTRGDVQPYIALGVGLKAAGIETRILTSDDFGPLVAEAGLEVRSTGVSVESIVNSPEWRQTVEGGSFLALVARMNKELGRYAKQLAQTLPDLLAGTDIVLAGVSGLGGAFAVAEKLGLPLIQAYLFPLTPTREFAAPLFPSLPLGAVLNRPSFHLTRQAIWQSARIGDRETRRALKMPATSPLGPFRSLERRSPILYGYSRFVLPRPADWPARNHVTGYWFLDPPASWQPPADLVDFIQAGEPPVYIGFGSMGARDPAANTKLALKALQLAGRRGVLASGWGGLQQADLPASVFMTPQAPHSWLFPQMAAVVHHGGAGTTAAGLRAGVPSIVVPFFGDQPFWGRRIVTLGVGPAPLPRRRLTAEHLAEAIKVAVSSQPLRQRAARLGEQIRNENGVANAVKIIKNMAQKQR